MKALLFFALAFFVAENARALRGDHLSKFSKDIGNGGDVVYCASPSPRAELLDFHEARVMNEIPIKEMPGANHNVKLESALAVIAKRLPQFVELVREELVIFEKEKRFLKGQVLVDVPDSRHVAIPAGCEIRQIAIFREPQFPHEKTYLIDQDLWDLLGDNDRAALVLHEVLYRMSSRHGLLNSIPIRYMVSLVYSSLLAELTDAELYNVFAKARFSHIEFDVALGHVGIRLLRLDCYEPGKQCTEPPEVDFDYQTSRFVGSPGLWGTLQRPGGWSYNFAGRNRFDAYLDLKGRIDGIYIKGDEYLTIGDTEQYESTVYLSDEKFCSSTGITIKNQLHLTLRSDPINPVHSVCVRHTDVEELMNRWRIDDIARLTFDKDLNAKYSGFTWDISDISAIRRFLGVQHLSFPQGEQRAAMVSHDRKISISPRPYWGGLSYVYESLRIDFLKAITLSEVYYVDGLEADEGVYRSPYGPLALRSMVVSLDGRHRPMSINFEPYLIQRPGMKFKIKGIDCSKDEDPCRFVIDQVLEAKFIVQDQSLALASAEIGVHKGGQLAWFTTASDMQLKDVVGQPFDVKAQSKVFLTPEGYFDRAETPTE